MKVGILQNFGRTERGVDGDEVPVVEQGQMDKANRAHSSLVAFTGTIRLLELESLSRFLYTMRYGNVKMYHTIAGLLGGVTNNTIHSRTDHARTFRVT